MKSRRKEAFLVLGLVVVVAATGLYISKTNYRARVDYPAQPVHLQEDDFVVHSNIANIRVGRDSLSTLQQHFGKGRFLGMSSIYVPPGEKFRVRFPKKQDIVWIFETMDAGFSSARGIRAGDGVSKVITAYGRNYTKISLKGNAAEYDLVYGVSTEGNITFRIYNDQVTKLVVSRRPQ